MARKGNPNVTIRLTPDQIERLKGIAADKEMSLSALLRMAIQLFLLSEKK